MPESPVTTKKFNPSDYAYASGVVQALERHLISAETLNQMVEAENWQAAVEFLTDTDYAGRINAGQGPEELVKNELRRLRILHAKLLPDDLLTGTLFVVNDFQNLKYLVKSMVQRGEPQEDDLIPGWLSAEELVELVYEQPAKPRRQEAAAFTGTVQRALGEYEKWQDPAVIDYSLDRACFQYLAALFRFRKASFALGYLTLWVDLINLTTLLRLLARGEKQGWLPKAPLMDLIFLPGGAIPEAKLKTWSQGERNEVATALLGTKYRRWLSDGLERFLYGGSWVSIERGVEEAKITYLRRARLVACGYEPVFAYFLAKENECRLLQVVLKGKTFGLPPAAIRERLWGTYV
ncbi:MAG: V-type ATPase subunit [Firmicutes bacterium]|nr:V-type ATPase subunit [Bacillota bacterium]